MSRAAYVMIVLACLGASTALAQDSELAEAIALSRRGDDRGALERYEHLLTGARDAEVVARAGLAHMALGEWLRADELLREALAADDAWVRENQHALEVARRRCQMRLGRLEVRAPEGAAIRIGERELGTAPLETVLVEPGEIEVVASLQGHEDARATVRVDAGGEAQVELSPAAVAEGEARECADGRVDAGGACCWPRQRWIASDGRCEGTPLCPRGYRRTGTECARRSDDGDAPRGPFSGAEIQLLGSFQTFTDTSTGLFRASASDALDGPFGGGDVGFEIGGRPIWFLGFGLRLSAGGMTTANWLDGDQGASLDAAVPATLMMGSASAYLRIHSAEVMHDNQVDLFIGGGFGVGGALVMLNGARDNGRVWTYVVPIDGGLTYHPVPNFGLTIFGTLEPWILQEYCGEDPVAAAPYCIESGGLDIELRIRAGGGFTVLF